MSKKFILIGAKPPSGKVSNPGGQLTASIGLIDFIESMGYKIKVLDTTQSSFPVPSLKVRLTKGLNRLKDLYYLLKKEKFAGVIIFSSSGFSFYERIIQSLLCRFFSTPDVFFIRSGHFITSVRSSLISRFLAKILLKLPCKIGIQGASWASFYQELGIDKSRTLLVRNWLQHDFPVAMTHKNQPKDPIKFVFVGWLVKEKGVPQLLNAVKLLKSRYSFELHLVGGGTLEHFCEDFIIREKLQEMIFIHGWQDKKDVIDIVSKSDVFILPSEAEGFPNALLESIALGLPAICTNVGGVSDSLLNGQNGILLESNDSNAISDAMSIYLDSPYLISQHSKKSLEIYIKNHDRRHNCEILLSQFSK